MSDTTPFEVQVHPYASPVRNACAYELVPSAHDNAPRNAVIFVGGLGDGPHTVPYIRSVANAIDGNASVDFSVFEMRLRSSFGEFGTASLETDGEDIAALVKYLRGIGKDKIVLMGHSTGSQDCVAYAKSGKEPVDGFILQAPISDREALIPGLVSQARADEQIGVATELMGKGQKEEIIPNTHDMPPPFNAPMTAYRFHSLIAPGGDDDFFSTDLTDAQCQAVWSRFQKPLLVVPGADDIYYSKKMPYDDLLARWKSFCGPGIYSEFSGAVPGSNHTVDDAQGREDLSRRIVGFLQSVLEIL